MNVGLEQYLAVSFLLFALGLLGVVMRRNLLVIYMSLELMLNAANLALVSFSRFNNKLDGQVLVFFIITVAAAEVVGRPGAHRRALPQAPVRARRRLDHDETCEEMRKHRTSNIATPNVRSDRSAGGIRAFGRSMFDVQCFRSNR